jgi:hypothetical protein
MCEINTAMLRNNAEVALAQRDRGLSAEILK